MKHLSPTRMDLYNKSLQPKVQRNMDKITVEEALLFAEWANAKYDRMNKGWIETFATVNKGRIYTTRELWEAYNRFLGKKTP
jgi:tRNA A37 threonylcarbamoyladenosine biosynthesis protein TsaE